MPKLPNISSKKAIKVASKIGYRFIRQKGSHIILKNQKGKIIVIPERKKLKKGTLLQLVKTMELTKKEFTELL